MIASNAMLLDERGRRFLGSRAAFALRRAIAQLILIEAEGQPCFAASRETFGRLKLTGRHSSEPKTRFEELADIKGLRSRDCDVRLPDGR